MQARIEQKLKDAFAPVLLDVTNDSESHRGHAGYTDGNTHFAVKIRAAAFDDLSRVAQQRAIYAVLDDEFSQGLHALQLDVGGADKP